MCTWHAQRVVSWASGNGVLSAFNNDSAEKPWPAFAHLPGVNTAPWSTSAYQHGLD